MCAIYVPSVGYICSECKNEFAKEVMEHDLQVQTISLEEYKTSKIEMFCKDNCSRKIKNI